MSNGKDIDQMLERAKRQNAKDIEILIKDIKIHNKIVDKRNAKREEMKLKAEERERKVLENRRLKEELQKEKINKIKQRQKSKEINQLEQKFSRIVSQKRQTNFNGEKVEEFNEKNRKQYEFNINNKLSNYSANRQQYLDKIKDKFYSQNENVRNKMEYHIEEQKKENNDLKNEIDLTHAQRFDNYKTYITQKKAEIYERADKLNEKHESARLRKQKMIQNNENQIYQIVRDIRDGNEDESQNNNTSNTSETILKQIEKRNKVKQKQLENNSIIQQNMNNRNEEILINEFEKFKHANKVELEVKKKQQHNLLKTIFTQEEYDRKLENMQKKLNKLKNESVYRVDPSKISNIE